MDNVVVVMPFSEEWSELVWDKLEDIGVRSKDIDVVRVDFSLSHDQWLANHVEAVNKKAKIVIADITGDNPNVMIEVGLALASDTPLILITQDFAGVPAHLKGRLIETYDPNSKESMDRLQSTVHLRLKEQLKFIRGTESEKFQSEKYFVECFAKRRRIELQRYFAGAKVRVDILTTNLSFLLEEYDDRGRTYFDEIRSSLDAENSKLKIRILTLDPESDFTAKRGRQLGFSPRVFRDTLRKALSATRLISDAYETARFEVRTYDDFPNQIMYRVDDNVFHCVVAQPTQSRNHLTFKLDRRHQGVDTSFTEHFQYIWSLAA